MFRNDSKLVINFLMQYSKNELDNFNGLNQTIKNPNLVFGVYDAFSSGDGEWIKAYSSVLDQKKEGITMCDVVKELKKQGMELGRKQEREETAKVKEELARVKEEAARDKEDSKKTIDDLSERVKFLEAELAKKNK